MTQYNTLNIKLLDLQLYKLKSGIKNDTEVNFQQMLLVILKMRIILLINCH